MCSLQYTICSCHEYIYSTVKLSQFLQYLPKHALQSSSCFTILKDQQSGLDMEIWLTPIRTSTYERPFTQEGNYLVVLCVCLSVHGEKVQVLWSPLVTLESAVRSMTAGKEEFSVNIWIFYSLFSIIFCELVPQSPMDRVASKHESSVLFCSFHTTKTHAFHWEVEMLMRNYILPPYNNCHQVQHM